LCPFREDEGGEGLKLTIGLAYDLRSDYLAQGYDAEAVAEFDSDETIAALEAAIRGLGFQTDRIGNARALAARLVSGDRWDLVFNITEGLRGRSREAQAPCLLELFGVGYTFSDPLVCALTLDKAMAKRVVAWAGIPTPHFVMVRDMTDLDAVDLTPPVFAKPVAEGTGKGITARSRVERVEDLRPLCEDLIEKFAQPVLVEEFLPGREFTVGILGNGRDSRVLGIMEINVSSGVDNGIYSLAAKEECERVVRYARLERGPTWDRIARVALGAYRVLECRDAARVDIRMDRNGEPNFVEINPLPGLHPTHSDLPMIATQEGMEYSELIGSIVRSALGRLGVAG